MKIWLSKDADVPIRDQLVTQLTLALASGEIETEDRLPSRAELARRFSIHENTVSHAYKVLVEEGLIEFKHGSGFYPKPIEPNKTEHSLEFNTSKFVNESVSQGATLVEILRSVENEVERLSSDDFVVVESDPDLREILMFEVREASGKSVRGISPEEINAGKSVPGRLVALADEKRKLNEVPADCLYLKSRSITESMAGQEKPSKEDLIAVVSSWSRFVEMAETILLAAGVDAETIIKRDARESGWKRGLENAALVICDYRSSIEIGSETCRPFRFISDESIKEIQRSIGNIY